MRLILTLAALFPMLAIAETAYVTDNLRLRLYDTADLTNVIETLVSGDQLEVLSRNRQTALVRLDDGRQGYVAAGYIVYDKPAKLIVAESQAETERLRAEIAELEAAFAEPQALVARLEQQTAELQASLDAAVARGDDLEARNQSLVDRQARYRYSLPYTWVFGALVICLAAGVFLGRWWVDQQSRRRHGGIRVY